MGKPRTSNPAAKPATETGTKAAPPLATSPISLTPAPWRMPAAPVPVSSAALVPAPIGAPAFLPRIPDADADRALFETPSTRLPPRPPVRGRADGKPPEYTAVYRLYRADDELLYVGMSNSPLERFIEHRGTKTWWPDVATYSIEWFMTRDEAEDAETAAIKDEWPMHNVAHQPRANGAFVMPSYLSERLANELRAAIRATIEGATDQQVEHAEVLFRAAFDPEILPNSEIWFAESGAPDQRVRQNVEEVITALGSFRPPIATSTRVAASAPTFGALFEASPAVVPAELHPKQPAADDVAAA